MLRLSPDSEIRLDVNGITLYSVHWPSMTFSGYSQGREQTIDCQLAD